MSFEVFVLAAGLGTRLRPLTEVRPKPLVPVCGVPLLAWSLALAAHHGMRRVVVNSHWLGDQLAEWAGDREGCAVTVVHEPELLGTGGGLRNLADRLSPTFVVLNADVLHAVDLRRLRAAVPPGGAAMALRPDPDAARYGLVTADRDDRVVRLTSVASNAGTPARTDTHFTGIHALDREALALVPPGPQCIVRTAYQALVPRGSVSSIRYDGAWLDAGDPAAYLDANLAVLDGRVSHPLDPWLRAGWGRRPDGSEVGDPALVEGVVTEGPCWVGPSAQIRRGTRIARSIVAGEASGELSDSVVWEHGLSRGGNHTIAFQGGILSV
ncbi:MAG: NDP-sugar synthase [Deltaproteobacteria bacterium]|nr:NDP-sugar synthase [Deltaproteobacteria bacterium]